MRPVRRRVLNLLTVGSLLLCVAVGVLWLFSYQGEPRIEWGDSCDTGFGWRLYNHRLDARYGSLRYVRSYPPLIRASPFVPSSFAPAGPEFAGFSITRGNFGLAVDSLTEVYQVQVAAPLWAIALPAAVLPLAHLWRAVSRRGPGVCQSCGYDLTGNVSGVCPECGRAR
jgi:hypothetical protein